ncbi:hypothetical protein HC956_08185 [Alcaligenes faecalis]|uniref:Uncharacterized protein n=1 Tax=Alcaligenes ammonioxydans TaxID=2582914 RepID=A0ABX8SSI4_9BURK|nr:hypothetical protein [Alcaligenes ammonioxydans]QXX78996.1 hypothetical protein FE795_08185 [Alcaligenes ammonioxydans]
MKYRVPFVYEGQERHVDVSRPEDAFEPAILEIIAEHIKFTPIIPDQAEGRPAPLYTELLQEQLGRKLTIMKAQLISNDH